MSQNSDTITKSQEWIPRLAGGEASSNSESRRIASVSVIGAGVMGRGIATANVKQGLPVTLSDTSEESLAAGVAEIAAEFGGQQPSANLIRGSQSREELAAADLVIEAVIERTAVKQRIFQKLEPLVRRETIFASNTSSIPITQIAAKLSYPDRFVGLHFCHPVAERPLLEIVRGEKTSDHTIATAVNYAQAIGKRPVVVKDSPGFVVNRLLTPYLNEALELLLEGVTIEEIDAATISFGMPVGPLAAIDGIGIDVALRAGTIIYEAFPERIVSSELLVALFERGDLGRKTGQGFYTYDASQQAVAISPIAQELIQERQRKQCIYSQNELMARLLLPMLTEAGLALEEGLVETPQDIDEALMHGIGFPQASGGVLTWADRLGMQTILKMLTALKSLGPRFQPSALFQGMATEGRGFYRSAA